MEEIQNMIQSLVDGGFDIETIKTFFESIASNPVVAEIIAKVTSLIGGIGA